VWRLARDLGLEIYRVTSRFPDEERYGLTSQLRRGVVSVKSNIAEGAARRTTKDFLHYCYVARASLDEIDSQLEFAGELGYLDGVDLSKSIDYFDNLSRGLQGLIDSLHRKLARA
jgi:four helix bundle protein